MIPDRLAVFSKGRRGRPLLFVCHHHRGRAGACPQNFVDVCLGEGNRDGFPCQWVMPEPVTARGPGKLGIGIGARADQGKDGPVAIGYGGERARRKVRHPVSLNIRISALWKII